MNHTNAKISQVHKSQYDCDVVINCVTNKNFVNQSHHKIVIYHHTARIPQFHCRKNNIAKCMISNIPVGLAKIDAAKNNHDRIA